MIDLIIVEDEDIARETLCTIIDWNQMGIRLLGACRDGIEAYHMIMDENPAIIVTDIRMPGMNGLELIEKISQTDIITEFILLSGYADFTYAQKAMAFHVQHYLTKPCSEAEIAAAVRSAGQDYYRRRQIHSICPELNRHYVPVSSDSGFIDKMTDYIDSHLSNEQLTLKYVAEQVVFMNPDYVGKQFYQAKGEKFSSYLTRKRIQQAKKMLLLHPDMRILDIAEAVGCGNNPQYFGQIFKRETGMAPSAWVSAQRSVLPGSLF